MPRPVVRSTRRCSRSGRSTRRARNPARRLRRMRLPVFHSGLDGKNLRFDGGGVRFARPGMALTLNGIAQGYIADRVAAMLRAEGLTDVMVDTGELHALGGRPGGGDRPVALQAGGQRIPDAVHLRDRALASSAPTGTRIGTAGHILNPETGRPAPSRWTLVSVAAPSAAIADGLSTAGCLMSRKAFARAVGALRGRRLSISPDAAPTEARTAGSPGC
ncbi:FAD:protein FMN transferase [Jhaorihella thermophila]